MPTSGKSRFERRHKRGRIDYVLDPATLAFVQARSSVDTPFFLLEPHEARASFARLHDCGPIKLPVSLEDTRFPVGPAGSVDVRIVRPLTLKRRLPVIIYLHGGGWVTGDRNTHDRLIRELAVGSEAALFFIEYTPAPEKQYPYQIEQAYAAMVHLWQNADHFNVDAARLAVAGDGSGGNMAAAIALIAMARKGPKIALQALFYPVTDDLSDNLSYRDYADSASLSAADMAYFFDSYFPGQAYRDDTVAFPLRATIDELRGSPEALVIVDEHDILREEGEAYARKLIRAGVPVTSVRYNNTVHGFLTFDALAETPPARAAVRQATCALKYALNK